MSGLKSDWALQERDKFMRQTVMRNASGNGYITTSDRTAWSDAEVAKLAQIVEKVFARVLPKWREGVTGEMANSRCARDREAAIRAREELARGDEIRRHLGDNASQISAAALHPWIRNGAKFLWQSRFCAQAVQGTVTKLNGEMLNKVGHRKVSETDLFKQSFSLDVAQLGKSCLRRTETEDSDTHRSVQLFVMAYAEGVFARIRKPLSHEAGLEVSEQMAVEYLAALSVLVRWVEESTVEIGGEAT
ncbi:TIGR02391 family protein [Curtobacterium flaccumfaciens pv. flaccumfaciens]